MRYLGGKGRLAKQIACVILSSTKRRDCFLETCLGGAHAHEQLAPHFAHPHAGDVHPDLVMMWQAAARGWTPPTVVTEDQYRWLKDQPPSALRGFVGFACSFAGLWFQTPYRDQKGVPLEYTSVAANQSNVVVRTARALARSRIEWTSYESWAPLVMAAPERFVVYSDPPYAGTATYDGTDAFDHLKFWRTLDQWADAGAEVFVSEYTAPAHWHVLGEVEHTCMVSASRSDETGKRVERLFSRPPQARPAPGWEAEFLSRVEEVRASRQAPARGRVVQAPAPTIVEAPFARFSRTAMVVR
jgi:site-specific DNA-adenine methylase